MQGALPGWRRPCDTILFAELPGKHGNSETRRCACVSHTHDTKDRTLHTGHVERTCVVPCDISCKEEVPS